MADEQTTPNRDRASPMTKRERTARSFATTMIGMGWRSENQELQGEDLHILPGPVTNSAVLFADALFDALERATPKHDNKTRDQQSKLEDIASNTRAHPPPATEPCRSSDGVGREITRRRRQRH